MRYETEDDIRSLLRRLQDNKPEVYGRLYDFLQKKVERIPYPDIFTKWYLGKEAGKLCIVEGFAHTKGVCTRIITRLFGIPWAPEKRKRRKFKRVRRKFKG